MTKKIILGAVLILAIGLIGKKVYDMSQNYVNIRGARLNEYEEYSGGGMNGGYYNLTIRRYQDGQALIRTESADWHYQNPVVKESLTDAAVLDELEAVIRKNHMNFWDGKTFTDMFVADGESYGYRFGFDKDSIRFSSQIYPSGYREKLNEFKPILKKYTESAQALPGVVNPHAEQYEPVVCPKNEVMIYASYLRGDKIYFQFLNGKAEPLEIPRSYQILNTDTNEVIAEEKDTDSFTVYRDESYGFNVPKRPEAGNYKLVLEGYEVPFEIR